MAGGIGSDGNTERTNRGIKRSQSHSPSRPRPKFPVRKGKQTSQTGSISTKQLTIETTFGPALCNLGLSDDPFTAPELGLSNPFPEESAPSVAGMPQSDTNSLRTGSISTEQLTIETTFGPVLRDLDLSSDPFAKESFPSGSVSQLRPSTGYSQNDPGKTKQNTEEQVRTEQFKSYTPEEQQEALEFLNQKFPDNTDNTATDSKQEKWKGRIYTGKDGNPVKKPNGGYYTNAQMQQKQWRDKVYTDEDGNTVINPRTKKPYTNGQMSGKKRNTKVYTGEDGNTVKNERTGQVRTTVQINNNLWNQRIYIGRDGKTINDEETGKPLTNRQVRYRKEKAKEDQQKAAAAEQTGAQTVQARTASQIRKSQQDKEIYTDEDGNTINDKNGNPLTKGQVRHRKDKEIYTDEDGNTINDEHGNPLTKRQVRYRRESERDKEIYTDEDGNTINDEHGNPLTKRQVRYRREKAKEAQEKAAAPEQRGAQTVQARTASRIRKSERDKEIAIDKDGNTINDEHGNPLTNRQVRYRKEKAKKAQEKAAAAEQIGAQKSSSEQE